MKIWICIEPETDFPRTYRHDMNQGDVEDVLARSCEDRPGKEDSRVAMGQTQAGRHIQVI